MKQRLFMSVLFLPILLSSLSVQAHDPKEHMKNAENPNCAPMQNMDHSKMDMNDPVMQAMMKKCMDALHPEEHQATQKKATTQADGKTADDQHSEHQH